MITLTKFQSIVERLMTKDEILERSTHLGLPQKTTDFIVKRFDEIRQWVQDDNDLSEGDIACGNGRAALGLMYGDTWNDFAVTMGVDESLLDPLGTDPKTLPHVEAAFVEFFDE